MNSFNSSRLKLLLKNHLVEHRQKYTYYALGMFLIGLIIFVFTLSVDHFGAVYDTVDGNVTQISHTRWERAQTSLYLAGLFVFGAIFSCVSFVNFGNKGEAIFYFIKPASQLEKWLTEVIVRIFLFFIVYTVIFYVIDIPSTWLVRTWEYQAYLSDMERWSEVDRIQKIFHPSSIFFFSNFQEGNWIVYPILLSTYISVIAFFMYGAVLFNSYSFFKTLILGFATFIVYLAIGLFLFNRNSFNLIDGWYLYSLLKAKCGNLEAEISDFYLFVTAFFLAVFVPAVLLTCSYLKLQEKEV